jgi:hypothetical protein
MLAVNFDLMYQATVGVKGTWNQIVYWSHPLNWKNETLTPNPDTLYGDSSVVEKGCVLRLHLTAGRAASLTKDRVRSITKRRLASTQLNE